MLTGSEDNQHQRRTRLTPSGDDEVTLVVGGNDCDSNSPRLVDDIVNAYSMLIDSAKTKAKEVTASGIP